jgi:hypothetical protein
VQSDGNAIANVSLLGQISCLNDEVKLKKSEIKSLLIKNPRYLDESVYPKVLEFVKWLREMDLNSSEEIHQVLFKYPTALSCNLEGKVKPFIRFLEEQGILGDRTIKDLLLNSWNSLNYSIERIKARQEQMTAVGLKMTTTHIPMKPEVFEAILAAKSKASQEINQDKTQ